MTGWPAWATESVEVRPSDPGWQQAGERERQALEVALAPWLVARVAHIGSTAVPGLAAKPILDLQAGVANLCAAPVIAETLTPSGWHYVTPDLDRRPWRRFFVKVSGDRRIAHLHVMEKDSARWEEQLAFRDALRGDTDLVEAYAALKRELAARHGADREAYTAAKADFIRAALERGARRDRTGGGGTP